MDQVLDALGHRYRRRVLVALADSNPQTVGSVTATVQAHEGVALHGLHVADFETALHHIHLPKLENYGFISWDRATDELTRGPGWADIGPVVELLRDNNEKLPEEFA